MIAKVLAIAAAGVSIASATCTYPPPLTNQLTGNSVTRPDTVNPATIGSPFSIVWDATGLSSSVSLILLRGPGENIQFLEYIVQGAPNTGSYTWTPESSLTPDTTHYGIMMIDEADCKFQWSSQFGLNPGSGVISSSVAPTSSALPPPPASTSSAIPPPPASSSTTCDEEGPSPPTGSAHPHSSYSKGSHPPPPAPTESCDEEGPAPPTGHLPPPPAPTESCDEEGPAGPTGIPPPPPPPTSSCDEEGPAPTGAPAKTWTSVPAGGWGGYGSAPWAPSNGTATSAYWATGTGAATGTYAPLQANGAATLGMSIFGAASALVAAIMLL